MQSQKITFFIFTIILLTEILLQPALAGDGLIQKVDDTKNDVTQLKNTVQSLKDQVDNLNTQVQKLQTVIHIRGSFVDIGNPPALTIDSQRRIGVNTKQPISAFQINSDYLQINHGEPPPDNMCGDVNKIGRMRLDWKSAALYVCMGANGWKKLHLN